MIKVFSFGPAFGLVDASPFVVKVDAFLRMNNLPFEVEADLNNLKKSPKGKLPFIEENGKKLGDSHFIISQLKDKHQLDIDAWLTPEQQGMAHLISKAIDEDLYWSLVYSRWLDDATWPRVKEAFFSDLPWPLKSFLPAILRKDVKKTIYKQGLGRHSHQEILTLAKQNFDALSKILADKPYFLGDKLSSIDATAFAMLAEFILVDIDNEFNAIARSFPNLVSYCQRLQKSLYSD